MVDFNANAGLTELESISYLLSKDEGEKMPGHIRTKEKCPKCNRPYEHIEKIGFICKEHRTVPQRFFIDVYHGKQIKIYSHKSGLILSSYDLAVETLKHIQYEIRNKTFDPSKYVKAEISQYQCDNLIAKFLLFKGVIDFEGKLIRDGDKSCIAPSYPKTTRECLKWRRSFLKDEMLGIFGRSILRTTGNTCGTIIVSARRH